MSGRQITLSQACEGMIRYKQAAGKSDHTIFDYCVSFQKLLFYFAHDPPIASIPRARLVELFFAWLQPEYIADPDSLAPREAAPLSAQSVNNIHTSLSAPWHWALDEGLVKVNVIRQIEPTPIGEAVVQTFINEEVEALLQRGTATAKNRPSYSA